MAPFLETVLTEAEELLVGVDVEEAGQEEEEEGQSKEEPLETDFTGDVLGNLSVGEERGLNLRLALFLFLIDTEDGETEEGETEEEGPLKDGAAATSAM